MIKSLYKYMPYRTEFFENRLIRATPRKDLNDPFEINLNVDSVRSMFKRMVNGEHSLIDMGIDGFVGSTQDELSKHLYSIRRPDDALRLPFFDELGIVSLTETKDNLLMWSHYADEHRGYVIEFDHDHDFFTSTYKSTIYPSNGLLERVLYRKDRLKEVVDYWEPFFYKSDEWQYEKEHRLLLSLYDASVSLVTLKTLNDIKDEPIGELLVSTPFKSDHYDIGALGNLYGMEDKYPVMAMFEVPAEAIKSVILGSMMGDTQRDEICETIKSIPELKHINIQVASINPDHYMLDFEVLIR